MNGPRNKTGHRFDFSRGPISQLGALCPEKSISDSTYGANGSNENAVFEPRYSGIYLPSGGSKFWEAWQFSRYLRDESGNY